MFYLLGWKQVRAHEGSLAMIDAILHQVDRKSNQIFLEDRMPTSREEGSSVLHDRIKDREWGAVDNVELQFTA